MTREKLARAMRLRANRPVFVIDLAVPRDVDPAVNELDGVYLYDIDALQRHRHAIDGHSPPGAHRVRAAHRAPRRRVLRLARLRSRQSLSRDTPALQWRRDQPHPRLVKQRVVLGSRGSALALAQVRLVQEALANACPGIETDLQIITTSGDRRQEVRAGEGNDAGLKGLFTKEIQEALLGGGIDAAIHSLKDLPGITPDSLALAAVLPRADPSDLLISHVHESLDALPKGARVGTGSVRRRRQLLWIRPDLVVTEIRGNVPTRLEKLATGALDAIILARAGMDRLGYTVRRHHLQCEAGSFHATTLPILCAIGQGAVGIEIRADDAPAREIFAAIDHEQTHACIHVERELLRMLDGDCRLPVAAHAVRDHTGILHAEALVFPDDEKLPPAFASATGKDPATVAAALFSQLTAQ